MRGLMGSLVMLTALAVAPAAKADLLFVGSQVGLNAFNVDLMQVSSTEVNVTVTLTEGAQFFVDTGSGQHPGFAFNISGDPAVTIDNISSPWTTSDIHTTPVTTGGPGLGTFDYFIDNPGPGASKKNPGPLSFDVTLGTGLSVNDFVANSNGTFFVADIMDSGNNTGLSGITARPSTVPEPSSIFFLLAGSLACGLAVTARRRASKER